MQVTEYPADSVADALEDARDQCDAVCSCHVLSSSRAGMQVSCSFGQAYHFGMLYSPVHAPLPRTLVQLIIVVDPSSSSSAAYCESALAGVPDNVPCLVVACPRGSVPSSGLQSTCDSLEVWRSCTLLQ